MNNKTATDSYVPIKKQGKRSKKKHLSKEAFRKIRYKQNMWRVYKHTGTDKDYDAYKEALNAATNEVRKSTRNVEHKLAHNIKSDSKSHHLISSGVLLGLPTLLHFFLSLGMVIDSL